MRKLTLEDDYSVVTIDDKTGKVGANDAVQQCRDILAASGYHADNIAALMPDENELDKIIEEAVKYRKEEIVAEVSWSLEAIARKCREWRDSGGKNVTKSKMLDIIEEMTKIDID